MTDFNQFISLDETDNVVADFNNYPRLDKAINHDRYIYPLHDRNLDASRFLESSNNTVDLADDYSPVSNQMRTNLRRALLQKSEYDGVRSHQPFENRIIAHVKQRTLSFKALDFPLPQTDFRNDSHMFDSRDKTVVAICFDSELYAVRNNVGQTLQNMTDQEKFVGVILHPYHPFAAAIGADNYVYRLDERTMKITNASKKKAFQSLFAKPNYDWCCETSTLAISIGKSIRMFDFRSGTVVKTFATESLVVKLKSQSNMIAAACRNGSILLYDCRKETRNQFQQYVPNLDYSAFCCHSTKHNTLTLTAENGTFSNYFCENQNVENVAKFTSPLNDEVIIDFCWLNDASELLVVGRENKECYNIRHYVLLRTGELVETAFYTLDHQVLGIRFDAANDSVVICSDDEKLLQFQLAREKKQSRIIQSESKLMNIRSR